MLSIGKLAAGQARYYLDQAEARVDVVASVGSGVEDYYAGGSESRGRWIGIGARELGLEGAVDGQALRDVLAGLDPRSGESLRRAATRVRLGGFDLTFSAPKSVSVLFGLGGPGMEAAVRAAHDRAVVEALGYLERSAAMVRRGHAGAVVEPADGLVAAAFRHRTSRAGDPQLHTHVLVANLGRGPDGRWSALDGRRIYAHARAASFVYQAVLRGELTRSLGLEWTPVRSGIAEVAGVPRPVLRAFSRRRLEIEAELETRGTTSVRAAEAAALATRQVKDRAVTAETLADGWRDTAAALGFSVDGIERAAGRPPTPDASAWRRVFDELGSQTGLTHRRSTFTRRDAIQAMCELVPPGSRVDAATLEAATDRFLASSRVIPLIPHGADREAFRRRDGRLLPVLRDELRYSTPELLAVEQRLVGAVERGRNAGAGVADRDAVAAAERARPGLAGEQREMVRRLCLDGAAVDVVAGKAGTGKTFALAAAREAWEASGFPVLGAAVARRAARELQDDSRIASTSVAALLAALRARPDELPARAVLVIDEAGMVPTRQLAELVDHAGRVGGKLVLVGDHRQLPALEAGGAFRGLVTRGLAIELRENRRQENAWERTALDHLRDGRADEALALYQAHDRLTVSPTAGGARRQLVRDWWGAGDLNGAVMIAHRRADVADLNARARRLLHGAGVLGRDELTLAGGEFAVGDRVVVKANDVRRGINNGDRAQIVALDRDGLTIETGRGRVRLGRDFLDARTAAGDPTLVHGYAITAHVAQGMTVDRAFVLAGDTLDRELAYTALSRGRKSNRLYVTAGRSDAREEIAPVDHFRREPVDALTARLRDSGAAALAIDTGIAASRRELHEVTRQRAAAERDQQAARAAAHSKSRTTGLAGFPAANAGSRTRAARRPEQASRLDSSASANGRSRPSSRRRCRWPGRSLADGQGVIADLTAMSGWIDDGQLPHRIAHRCASAA
ncbi:MAG TPA: MobF family relaxase [Solirubrobacteraceae bacterium]|nr:MobF family relaxase [Solirubrobacteraceae bacterium]